MSIRELNDAFRKDMSIKGKMMTHGVASLPIEDQLGAWMHVVAFKNFTQDNDPDGEHDFGGFESKGNKFYWKIDYYDKDLEQGSEDPSDPTKTTRILTLMLASEY